MVGSLRLENLEKWYGEHLALGPMSEQIEGGTLTIVVGENGAGKTTLLRCICGLDDYGGNVIFDGLQGPPVLSVVFDDPVMPREITVKWLLRMYRLDSDALYPFGLNNEVLKKQVRNLSFGQRKRLALALAFSRRPTVALLDEPLAGVDEEGCVAIVEFLARAMADGTTIVATTHSPLEFCNLNPREIRLKSSGAQLETLGRS